MVRRELNYTLGGYLVLNGSAAGASQQQGE